MKIDSVYLDAFNAQGECVVRAMFLSEAEAREKLAKHVPGHDWTKSLKTTKGGLVVGGLRVFTQVNKPGDVSRRLVKGFAKLAK